MHLGLQVALPEQSLMSVRPLFQGRRETSAQERLLSNFVLMSDRGQNYDERIVATPGRFAQAPVPSCRERCRTGGQALAPLSLEVVSVSGDCSVDSSSSPPGGGCEIHRKAGFAISLAPRDGADEICHRTTSESGPTAQVLDAEGFRQTHRRRQGWADSAGVAGHLSKSLKRSASLTCLPRSGRDRNQRQPKLGTQVGSDVEPCAETNTGQGLIRWVPAEASASERSSRHRRRARTHDHAFARTLAPASNKKEPSGKSTLHIDTPSH